MSRAFGGAEGGAERGGLLGAEGEGGEEEEEGLRVSRDDIDK